MHVKMHKIEFAEIGNFGILRNPFSIFQSLDNIWCLDLLLEKCILCINMQTCSIYDPFSAFQSSWWKFAILACVEVLNCNVDFTIVFRMFYYIQIASFIAFSVL